LTFEYLFKLFSRHSNKYNDRLNIMRIDNYTSISRSRVGWNRQVVQFGPYFYKEYERKDSSA
jgi:hypothetical protein